MLRDFRIHPLLATSDAVRARAWYADKLGLEPVFEREGQLVYSVPPTVFTVYHTPSAGTAQNTVAVWTVDDLRAEMARLRARGVTFEELDFGPDDRTVDGIMTSLDGPREISTPGSRTSTATGSGSSSNRRNQARNPRNPGSTRRLPRRTWTALAPGTRRSSGSSRTGTTTASCSSIGPERRTCRST